MSRQPKPQKTAAIALALELVPLFPTGRPNLFDDLRKLRPKLLQVADLVPYPFELTKEDTPRLKSHFELLERAIQGKITDNDLDRMRGLLARVICEPRRASTGKVVIAYPTKAQDWISAFETESLRVVLEAIADGGEAYFGACPRCGKVFVKSQSNEIYDRETCRVEFAKKKSYSKCNDCVYS